MLLLNLLYLLLFLLRLWQLGRGGGYRGKWGPRPRTRVQRRWRGLGCAGARARGGRRGGRGGEKGGDLTLFPHEGRAAVAGSARRHCGGERRNGCSPPRLRGFRVLSFFAGELLAGGDY
jgi:hypothetical protein